jgi:hypothetical protein
MARYHRALQKIIPPGANDPQIKAVGVVYHIAVSEADTLFDYFNYRSGGIESHFYIRRDGTVEQYRDTDYEADAQSQGNSFFRKDVRCGFISVETEGMERGLWTPEQVKSMILLGRWAQKEHGFKRQKCVAWNSDGFGYHRLFDEWNPNHHSCPGPDRVPQFEHEVLPLLVARKSLLDKRPNLKAAVDNLEVVRKNTKEGSPLRAQIDRFVSWVKNR